MYASLQSICVNNSVHCTGTASFLFSFTLSYKNIPWKGTEDSQRNLLDLPLEFRLLPDQQCQEKSFCLRSFHGIGKDPITNIKSSCPSDSPNRDGQDEINCPFTTDNTPPVQCRSLLSKHILLLPGTNLFEKRNTIAFTSSSYSSTRAHYSVACFVCTHSLLTLVQLSG